MFDFYQKRKLKIILSSRYIQVLVLFAVILMMWSAFNRYQIAVEMEERREAVEGEVVLLEERKKALEEEVQYLSDERGIEAEMRRQFDVAKDGEKVVVIVDEEEDENVETVQFEESTNERSWYEFWR